MRLSLTRIYAASFAMLLVFFAAGWYSLTLGPENPIPWPIQSLWGSMITVGQGFEALIGYVPVRGRHPLNAAIVIVSSALIWACVLAIPAGILHYLWSRRTAPERRS